MVVERKQVLGSVSLPMERVVGLIPLMLRNEILCGHFIVEIVRFKLNDMNIWSEMGISVGKQLKRKTPE